MLAWFANPKIKKAMICLWHRAMKPSLLIFGFGVLLAASNAQARDQDDLQKLQGIWKLVSAAQDGKPLPNDKVKETTIVFKGDSFLFPGSAEHATSKEGTIKVDTRKKPKQMDAASRDGKLMLGIYDLNGDHYEVCFAPTGKPRPSDFGSKPRSGYIVQVWQCAMHESERGLSAPIARVHR